MYLTRQIILAGYTVKGANACRICDENMIDKRLHHCGKNVYLHYRTWLPLDHPFRRKKKLFNGKVEMREAPVPLRGKEVSNRVKDIETIFGKPFKSVSKVSQLHAKDIESQSKYEIHHASIH